MVIFNCAKGMVNMKKYEFKTSTHIRTRAGYQHINTVEKESATITIEGTNIIINTHKESHVKGTLTGEQKDKKDASKNGSIFDIQNICFRKSKNYMNTLKTGIGFAIFMFVFAISNIIMTDFIVFWDILEVFGVPLVFGLGLHVVVIGLMILHGDPTKEFAIRFQDNEVISFAYYRSDLNQLKELREYLKSINSDIKELNTEKIITKSVLFTVSLLLGLQLFWIGFGYYDNYKYKLREQELQEAIENNNYYIDEEEVCFLKRVGGDPFGYGIYESMNEFIKIKEADIETSISKSEWVIALKIYAKEPSGKLLAEKYVDLPSGGVNNSVTKYGYSYRYDYSTLYKLKEPVENFVFFDKEARLNSETHRSIYEYLYSDAKIDNLGNDSFQDYEQVEFYNSKYGKCYIIKNISATTKDVLYCMYVDIDGNTYEGFILEKKLEVNEKEEDIIKYFKNSLPETEELI